MCIYCRDTDEMCSHTAPPVSWADLAHPSPSYLLGRLAAAEDALRNLAQRYEALEIMVLELRSRERLSREP